MKQTDLSKRMRRLAEDRPHQQLPEGWHEAADAFDAATAGYLGDPQTVSVGKFVAAFARARRLWCEATGESLI